MYRLSAQAAGMRQTFSGGLAVGALPAGAAALWRCRMRSQGTSATPVVSIQMPSGQVQPCQRASGTAMLAASVDDTSMPAVIIATTRLTCSGSLRLARAGSSTLPMAMAADSSAVPSTSVSGDGRAERSAMPAISTTREATSTFSMPWRRPSRAAQGENSAKASTGSAVTKPMKLPETPRSSRIMPTSGPMVTMGDRRLKASAATANSSSQPSFGQPRRTVGVCGAGAAASVAPKASGPDDAGCPACGGSVA